MDAQGEAAPEAPIPCQSHNTTWQHLQDFTLLRCSLRATELLESAVAIALLPARGTQSNTECNAQNYRKGRK